MKHKVLELHTILVSSHLRMSWEAVTPGNGPKRPLMFLDESHKVIPLFPFRYAPPSSAR
jgi:hypothetical protein